MQTEKNGIVYLLYLVLCLGAAVYFVSSGNEAAEARAERQSGGDDAIAALFGGGNNSGGSAPARAPRGQSLFDSEFYEEGRLTERIEDPELPADGEEGEPRILEAADPENPVNPQTGERYTNRVMQTFDKLRERFPKNDLIPRRMTEEERQQQNAERARIMSLQSKIAAGQASEGDVQEFYDSKAKPMTDRVQLVNYVLEAKGAEMSDSIKEQYQKILTMSEDQLKAIEAQREMALKRLQEN